MLDGLYEFALSTSARLQALKETRFPDIVPIEIFHGDMVEVDWWSTADIVYASSVCFPDELIEAIARRAALLRKGARIITLKNFPACDYLRLDLNLKLKMSWGRCQVLVYTVV